MVAVAHPVEVGGVQGVAPGVLEQAVLVVMRGELGVAVELAAHEPERLAARVDAVVAQPCLVGRLVGVNGLELQGRARPRAPRGGRLGALGVGLEPGRVQVVLSARLRVAAAVGAVDRPAGRRRAESSAGRLSIRFDENARCRAGDHSRPS